MSYSAQATINHNQSSNDADGIVTQTIPGVLNDMVVLIGVINNASAISTCTDNGNAANPWTRLNSPNPDVVASNTDVSVWIKKLGSVDVGKTVTFDAGAGGVRLPVAMAAFGGRGNISDVIVTRASDTDGNTTVDPGDVAVTGGGWDIIEAFAVRVAAASQVTMSGVPANHTKRSEAATNFGASPNFAVSICSRDNVGPGTFGTGVATFSQAVNQAIEYTIALKQAAVTNVPPTCNAGSDQTNIEPYANVNLHGTDSDSDGSITSRAWTVSPSGAAAFLSGQATADAVAKMRGTIAGETVTFTYTVIDNSAASTSDTMTVTTLPVTERAAIGGVMVPMEVRTA